MGYDRFPIRERAFAAETPPAREVLADSRGALFVISTAFRQVSATEANPDIEGEIDITSGSIGPTAEIASIVADPKVRAFAVANLEQLQHRVRASLGVA